MGNCSYKLDIHGDQSQGKPFNIQTDIRNQQAPV